MPDSAPRNHLPRRMPTARARRVDLLIATLLCAGAAGAQPRTGRAVEPAPSAWDTPEAARSAPTAEPPTAEPPTAEPTTAEPTAAAPTAAAPTAAEPTAAEPTAADLTAPESLVARGEARAAQRALTEAVARAPDSPALHYQLAVAAAVAGDRVVAREAALNAARLDPGSPPAVALAAGLHLAERGQAPSLVGEDALRQAEQALAEGRLRTAAHLAADAVAAYGAGGGAGTGGGAGADHAVRPPVSGQTDARLMLVRGLALLGLGRAEEALPALRAAATAGAGGGETWLALGVAYAATGRPEASAVCLDVARSSAAPRGAVAAAAREALARPPGPARLPAAVPQSLRKTGAPP